MPQGTMASKWRQVGFHIDRDAVERHPAPQPHADGGDLVFMARALVRPLDPDADPVLAALAAHVEGRERPDDPFLEARDIGPHVGPPSLQVEHHIGHPLAGAVIGELAAAPGREQRKTGVEQVGIPAAGSGGVERGVFQQPDQFGGLMGRNRRDSRLHGRHGLRIGHRRVRDQPFDRAAAGRARKRRQIEVLAVINHWLTITW